VEDGQPVEVTPNSIKLGERFETIKHPAVENLFVDGSPEALQQKHALAKAGIVFVALFRNRKSGKLLSEPVVSVQGLLLYHGSDEEKVILGAKKKLVQVNEDLGDNENFEDIVKLETRRYFRKHASYKPVVIPVIING
jgi:mRNA degradation ribonuclease J1/J2